MLITIRKAIDASPELRSKKQLIETFIAGVNDVDDVMSEWNTFVSEQREKELVQIIQEEKLKEPEPASIWPMRSVMVRSKLLARILTS